MKHAGKVWTKFGGFFIGIREPDGGWSQYYCAGAFKDLGLDYLICFPHVPYGPKSKEALKNTVFIQVHSIADIRIERAGNGETIIYDDAILRFLNNKSKANTKRD